LTWPIHCQPRSASARTSRPAPATAAGDWTKAEESLRTAVQKMDRIATKGTIHKNTAARKRSRLTKRLNAARAKAATGGKGAGTTA
jgi:small subunit ribosomal protein S20